MYGLKVAADRVDRTVMEASNNSNRPQRAPLDHVLAFEQLRNANIDYQRRPSKKLEKISESLRRELALLGYSAKAISNVEQGLAGVPMPS